MPYTGRGENPTFTPLPPAEAGTEFSNRGGMQGWVDLCLLRENGPAGNCIRDLSVTHSTPYRSATTQHSLAIAGCLRRTITLAGRQWKDCTECLCWSQQCQHDASRQISKTSDIQSAAHKTSQTNWTPSSQPPQQPQLSSRFYIRPDTK